MSSSYSHSGMITAPHHLAAEAGADILQQGGNAVEAMVAAAATIAVVYPHMNSIGGDGFWLVSEPGKPIRAIEACGPASQNATLEFYKQHGYEEIPARGPHAALTVAGTISGWQKALEIYGGNIPLVDLLTPAIQHAENGISITEGQADLTLEKWPELKEVSGFKEAFAPHGPEHIKHNQKATFADLARTLRHLAEAGLDDFYRGDIARSLAHGLQEAGSPIDLSDLINYEAKEVMPLEGSFGVGQLYNMPPPTQGISSLMILGMFEKLNINIAESFAHHHGLIEAVKQAFILRNKYVEDPIAMTVNVQQWLTQDYLNDLVSNINMQTALPWPHTPKDGDTIWMGCADKNGCVVSFIQSTYWEFGSGIVPDSTGVVWQNRGASFSLKENTVNMLAPHKKPFHTLNPAIARLKDGRTISYGTMGGEGQPQTQSQIFSRHVFMKQGLQEAISAPRWLLGRTWGDETTSLKLENNFDTEVVNALENAGHQIEILPKWSSTMGHAGGVSINAEGIFEGGFDPRSDGAVIGL